MYKGFVYSFWYPTEPRKLDDKPSIIHRFNRPALSIPPPSSNFSQRKTTKKGHSAELSPLCRNNFHQSPEKVQTSQYFLHIGLDKCFHMVQHLFFSPFFKEQLTVIMLAKKSVALRHWAVGEYFSAPFKALNALGKHGCSEKLRVS